MRQVFVKGATRSILSRNAKLDVPKLTSSSEDQLVAVQNLQTQLKAFKIHMASYDIIDVMNIVVPRDVQNSPDLETTKYDLFDDFTQLHQVHVCNSNAWYNLWVQNTYVHNNMVLTLTFLQNNTAELLWLRCWD